MKKKYFKVAVILMTVLAIFAVSSCKKGTRISKDELKLREQQLDYVFDLTTVPTITIDISLKEWNQLLSNIDVNRRNEENVKVNFIFEKNGDIQIISNIGFRTRGNHFSRARPESRKDKMHNPTNANYRHAHFKLNFRKFKRGTRFMGLRGINLKWFNNDPSYIREVYCFDLFRRAGVYTATRSSYTKLYIKIEGDKKPAYFGIYELLEPVDKSFLETRFPNNSDGDLWKCLYGADFKTVAMSTKMGVENINPTNDKKSRRPPYDLKTNKKDFTNAKARLRKFIIALKKTKDKDLENWLDKNIDMDLFLKAQAVNVMVGMWDDYWVNQNNYYVYFDKRGKMYFIPYDYDNTLGTSQMFNAGTKDVFEWGEIPKQRPLTKFLQVPKYKHSYSNYIAELIDTNKNLFTYEASIKRIKGWQDMISPFVSNDTGEDMEILDRTAYWGNANFYRLYTGDRYGGPLKANFFKTRIHNAMMALGLEKKVKKAKIKISIDGLTKHPNKYYYTFKNKSKIKLIMKSKKPIAKLLIGGIAELQLDNPPLINELILNIKPNSNNTIPHESLLVMATDKDGNIKRKIFKVLKFDDSYKSPEIKGDTVTFRLKYSGTNKVEFRGPFNQWGETNKIFMKNAGNGFYELRTNKTFFEGGMYMFHIMEKDVWWTPDFANTNNIGEGYYLPLYIYEDTLKK